MDYSKAKSVISKVRGSAFAGIDTLTEVKLTGGKKNPMQGRVTKETVGSNVIVFNDISSNAYEQMVKRRMEKEGLDPENFEVKERKWGRRVGSSPFIEHKGNYYLETIFISSGKTSYFLDGEPIRESEIEGLKKPTPSPESQGGIKNKVIIRTYNLESIQQLRILKQIVD